MVRPSLVYGNELLSFKNKYTGRTSWVDQSGQVSPSQVPLAAYVLTGGGGGGGGSYICCESRNAGRVYSVLISHPQDVYQMVFI